MARPHLPEKLTPEFIEAQAWRPGPAKYYEMCDIGLYRRPLELEGDSLMVNMRIGTIFALDIRDNEKAVVWIYDLHTKKSYKEQGSKHFAKEYLDRRYIRDLRLLVAAYNKEYFPAKPSSARRYLKKGLSDNQATPMRKCTTCGCPTRDYRCSVCWEKIQKDVTSCDEPLEEYSRSY